MYVFLRNPKFEYQSSLGSGEHLANYGWFLNLSGFDRSTLALRNKMNTYFGQGFIQHNHTRLRISPTDAAKYNWGER
jgi:hypothetical protein